MLEVVISPVRFGRGLFCYSNFNCFHIDDKKETNLWQKQSLESLTIPKDI